MAVILIGPAEGPRCPTHGQMHFDLPCDKYVCRGFDGEGCEYEVTNEEWYATFKPIGYIDNDGVKFKFD
jgi:hypothetical protein